MTAGCARCGDCCAPVILSWPLTRVTSWVAEANNPHTEEGWARWLAVGGWEGHRDEVKARWDDEHEGKGNALFLAEHWTQEWHKGGGVYVVTCDMYDGNTRLCTAGDARPPICSGFPWYGKEPNERADYLSQPVDVGPGDARLGCSYIADLPPADRPEGLRPLIPLTVL